MPVYRPCRKCGHSFDDHDHDEDNSWCLGGLHDGTKVSCKCHHFQDTLTDDDYHQLVKQDPREVYRKNGD